MNWHCIAYDASTVIGSVKSEEFWNVVLDTVRSDVNPFTRNALSIPAVRRLAVRS
jgi:hypothetical protein